MSYNNIITALSNNITTVTINRPNKLNALNKETIEELHDAFKKADADKDTKVIILTGYGEKAFVAGADISEFANFNTKEGETLSAKGQELLFNVVISNYILFFALYIICIFVMLFTIGGNKRIGLSKFFTNDYLKRTIIKAIK